MKQQSWLKLSTEILLKHKRLVVYEDKVRLPNGLETEYIHYGKNDAACVIAINNEGKILVQKEYSYPPDKWLYQPPGGALKPGENPMEGAAREFAEECGLKGRLKQIGWYYVDNRRCANKFYVFTATDLIETKSERDAEEEFIEYWFDELEIDSMIQKGEIVNYSLLSAWALFKTRSI